MRGETQKVGDILDSLVTRLGLKHRLKQSEVVMKWEDIVGERIAVETKAEVIRGKTLFVNVTSPMWAQELNFLKPEIMKKIRQEIGRGIVTDIRFKSGQT